jgi:hypothetical protein
MMGERGRPPAQMTRRRAQVLAALESMGQIPPVSVPWAALAREVGLDSFRDAKRIVGDLKTMGKLELIPPIAA